MDTHEEKKSTQISLHCPSPSSLERLVNLLGLARRKKQAPVRSKLQYLGRWLGVSAAGGETGSSFQPQGLRMGSSSMCDTRPGKGPHCLYFSHASPSRGLNLLTGSAWNAHLPPSPLRVSTGASATTGNLMAGLVSLWILTAAIFWAPGPAYLSCPPAGHQVGSFSSNVQLLTLSSALAPHTTSLSGLACCRLMDLVSTPVRALPRIQTRNLRVRVNCCSKALDKWGCQELLSDTFTTP